MRKTATIILACLALAACGDSNSGPKEPLTPAQQQQAERDAASVRYLFTVDGCRVYSFDDYGNRHWLTTCPGSVGMQRHEGKTSRPVDVQTVESPR